MNKFLIVANTDKDINLKLSQDIVAYINEKGAKAVVVSDMQQHYNGTTIKPEYLEDVEAVIVLGGDGTMLRAAHSIGTYQVPLLGVNLGTLGFLTEVEESNAYKAIDRLLADDYSIEKRMMIEGRTGDTSFSCLNDVVITRAGFSRIIGLNIYVNEQLLDTYEADGVIVATPTGSTGYNLSAGGPIISPKSKAVVVTPISPHSLTSKSVVFDSADRIRIEVVKKRRTQETEAIVSFDGADNVELSAGESVEVTCSEREIQLIKMYDVSFYSVLREKIGGA
ncbi:NAD(+)/NADH kinase [Eubacterium sp. MSJ-21]|jgi:NAD+ kinase|nr:NAD(+)/NADH kinase [Eubacterium sp. MSJ-21]